MGAQTSKVARKLPTKARPETLHNIPNESPSTLGSMANVASGKHLTIKCWHSHQQPIQKSRQTLLNKRAVILNSTKT